ncbi:MAG: YbaB/EbfC family nucleoid-associated protein [Micavibrio sp.]|nr:YbaB/EbfC family nucleoid-associated protein [Micavibrio sp.]
MFGNMKDMMQQAQKMQFKMAEMQEKFKDIYVDGQAGGGLVKINMSCACKVKKIDIDPSLMTAEDKETLEDLIAAAVNNAIEAKDAKVKEETEDMMKSLGLPAGALGGGLPF